MKFKTRGGLIILGLCLILFISISCGQNSKPANPVELSPAELAIFQHKSAQGGNLHYHNLVLSLKDQIIFNSFAGQLTIAAADGQNSRPLGDQAGSNLVSDGSQIYYTNNNQADVLEKIYLDGTNHVRIGTTPLKYLIYENKLLYAIEADDGEVVELRLDGAGRRLLADQQAVTLNLSDNMLYITGADDTSGLSVINILSGNQEQLLKKRITSLNVCGDWLYFADPADNFRIYAYSLSQKKSWLISQFSIEKPFVISNGFLYYINSFEQNRLYRLPVNGSENLSQKPELIIDDAVNAMSVSLKEIFYQRPNSSRIYKVPISGGQVLRIT